MIHLRLLLLEAAALALLSGCPSSTSNSVAEREEQWHRLLLNRQPAGFSRERVRTANLGGHVTELLQRLVLRRGEEPVQMEVEQEIEERADGAITRFRMVQKLASTDQVSEGRVRDSTLEVTSHAAGKSRTQEFPYDPRAVGPQRHRELLRTGLRREGDTVVAVTFLPEKNECTTVTTTLGRSEEIALPGGPRTLRRRVSMLAALPGIELAEWVDAEGEVWKTATTLIGQSVETYRASAAEILREKYASPPEIFYASSVRTSTPLRNAGQAKEVLYRFKLKQGDFRSRGIDHMFRGAGQTLVQEETPSTRVVRIVQVRPEKPVLRPVRPPAGEEATVEPNTLIQSDDPVVAQLARDAVRDETDAYGAALSLEKWVRQNVHFKDLKTAFASAREVADRREGDCTEHGVLLAALARASGIPARVIAGLVWYNGAFVGHLWTEVYIDQWLPLDGTRGLGEVGPDHIALSASALKSSAADLFFDLAQAIGNLEIEILEQK